MTEVIRDNSIAADLYGQLQPEGSDVGFIQRHWTLRELTEDGGSRWDCVAFQAATGLCGVHDQRPRVCSGYPWYGAPAPTDVDRNLDLVCAHHADLGRTVLPVVEINGAPA